MHAAEVPPFCPCMADADASAFAPVPEELHLNGYWAKVPELSAPSPMPIDVMLGASWMTRKAHESIRGIKVGARLVH